MLCVFILFMCFLSLRAPQRCSPNFSSAASGCYKRQSDIYAPVSGKIIEVNAALTDDPGLFNREPSAGGWFFRMEPADAGEIAALMDEGAYHSFVDSLA